jgi:hypothetical protein
MVFKATFNNISFISWQLTDEIPDINLHIYDCILKKYAFGMFNIS